MTVVANNLTNVDISYNNGKKIVVDSNDILYCCFSAQVGSYYQIFIYKSEDDGNTWINMNFPKITGYNQIYPSITVDNNNKIHITWCGLDSGNSSYQIKYSNNTSGSWVNWINIQTISGYYQCYPSIAIDSNNKIHIIWQGVDSNNSATQIKYSNNVSGSWSNWINIQTISNYNQMNASIAIDSNNKIYIIWNGCDSSNPSYWQIKYSNNISGTWSNWINILSTTGYHQLYPSIIIDNNNKVHIIWMGYDPTNINYRQIKYSNNISGTWSDWINIQTISGYSQYNPSIAIDSNNKIHVAWQGYDSSNPNYYQIKYSNNVSNSWATYINETSGNINYQNPSCIYKNGTFYCVYSGTSTIEFFSISFNKYLIEQNNQYYTINPTYYDSITTHNFIPLILNGGVSPNNNDFNNYGFNDISKLTTQVTYNTDTFIPYDKFYLGTKIYKYDGSNIILYDYKKGHKLLIQDNNRIKTTNDGINLIDLGTTYNEDTFNEYGMDNLNNINSTVLNKIINNQYKILMYKVK